jgi:hypothetical protein
MVGSVPASSATTASPALTQPSTMPRTTSPASAGPSATSSASWETVGSDSHEYVAQSGDVIYFVGL